MVRNNKLIVLKIPCVQRKNLLQMHVNWVSTRGAIFDKHHMQWEKKTSELTTPMKHTLQLASKLTNGKIIEGNIHIFISNSHH